MASGHKKKGTYYFEKRVVSTCKSNGLVTESGDLQARRQAPCHHVIISEGTEAATWEVCGKLFKNAAYLS